MLENLNRRTQARDFDPNACEPGYRELFEAFIEQDVEAETLLRQREKMAAYEQGPGLEQCGQGVCVRSSPMSSRQGEHRLDPWSHALG